MRTATVDPSVRPNDEFDYIDVSSVSNETFRIEATQRLKGKDAPSRARKSVATDDVLFATIRPTLKRIAIVPERLDGQVCSTGYFVLRPAPALHHRFLFYFLFTEHFLERMEALQKGASYPAVTDAEVRSQTVPVPPLPEQRRIVGILDEAFEGISTAKANAEKNLQNARAVFDGHLDAALSATSAGWVDKKLDSLCAITSALIDPRDPEYLDLLHVGAGNIETRTGRLIDLKSAREEGLISGKFRFDQSMVLYSKIRPYLMKVARPDFDGLCSADMYPLAPTSGEMERNYLFFLLLTKAFTDYAIKGSARAGMPKVNREYLFEYRTSVPKLKEQVSIARRLDRLSEETASLEAIYQQKLEALDELKKSLLHQAFSGTL